MLPFHVSGNAEKPPKLNCEKKKVVRNYMIPKLKTHVERYPAAVSIIYSPALKTIPST